MSTPQPTPYPLRMPAELRTQLEERAKTNGRSLNQEILALLQTALEGGGAAFDMDALADQLADKIAKKLKGK